MKIRWLLIAMGFLVLGGLYHAGYRVNTSPSYPLGLYQVATKAHYQEGDLVVFCPPSRPVVLDAIKRGYLKHGTCSSGTQPLMKAIKATQGAYLSFENVVRINHTPLPNYPVQALDSEHRPLPELGDFTLKENEFLVLSEHAPAGSFDGRYFGAIALHHIIGEARPIFTL